MYGPVVSNVQYINFIEIAATGDILVLSGLPYPSDLSDHDVILCFPSAAMAQDYIQRAINDGDILATGWVEVSYPNDAVGRAKVAATNVAHFAAVLTLHPFTANVVPTAG